MNPRNSPTCISNMQRLILGKRMLRLWLLPTMLTASVSSLLAHPGHEHPHFVPPSQPAHWFVEPEHALTWLLLGVLTWTMYRVLGHRIART